MPMATRIAAAALQYSKWMSRFICWAWVLYRFAALAAGIIRPAAANAFATTLVNLDWIMLVNEGTYLINSLGEKYIYSDKFILHWLNKGGLKNLATSIGIINEDEEPKDEETIEEGGDEDGDDNNG